MTSRTAFVRLRRRCSISAARARTWGSQLGPMQMPSVDQRSLTRSRMLPPVGIVSFATAAAWPGRLSVGPPTEPSRGEGLSSKFAMRKASYSLIRS